jgi:ubiquinone/menaquinone biosynthesis C-methylase UbiE
MNFDEKAAQRIEATYTTPDVSATRVAVFRALEPRSGERIADLGCGPGFMTQELARAVGPHGYVHALDLSEPMLGLAQRRCTGLLSVDLVKGDMAALHLPDGFFDAAVAMQSVAYVPEAACALAEIARVLRPGGRAVVLDSDFASLVWHGRDQVRVDRIFLAYEAHVAHPGLPRVLGRMASQAGLVTLRCEVVPILDVTFHPNTYAYGLARFIRDFVVSTGRVPEAEADAWLEECAELDTEGAFFMSLNRYLFVLSKPG